MRKIQSNNIIVKEMYCDRCGKKIRVKDGVIMEGVFSFEHEWGFFSEKDGEIHSADLCEKCYDEVVAMSGIKVIKKKKTEII